MSSQTCIPNNVFRSALGVADNLEPLKSKKSPAIAAACGAAGGGILLGLYLQSWRDFYIPFLMLLVIAIIAIPTGEILTAFTPVFWAYYGWRRVKASNSKLERSSGAEILEAEVITSNPPTIQIPTRSQAPIEVRFSQINDLFHKGILTQAEHDEKRQQILGEL